MAIQAQLCSGNAAGGLSYLANNCAYNNFSAFNQKEQLQMQVYLQQLQFQQHKNGDGNLDHHGQEIDRLLRLQNERLRLMLHEQTKRQTESLMKRMEFKAQFLLRQKDEEISQAAKKTMELEDLLRRLEMESQAWQRVARENEAMVSSLTHTLEQLQHTACRGGGAAADDAESCYDNSKGEEDKEATGEVKMICRNCNSRETSVLFIPCRHLSSCTFCEPFLGFCPVCRMVKKGTEEVLFS